MATKETKIIGLLTFLIKINQKIKKSAIIRFKFFGLTELYPKTEILANIEKGIKILPDNTTSI